MASTTQDPVEGPAAIGALDMFMHGSGKDEIPFRFDEAGRIYEVSRQFEGVIPNMGRLRESDSAQVREEFEKYQNNRPAAPATAIG